MGPTLLYRDGQVIERPAPPTPEMLWQIGSSTRAAAHARPTAEPTRMPTDIRGSNPFFRFAFRRKYENVFTVKKFEFVLRKEHYEDLKRLVDEFNRARPYGEFPLTYSDIVNAALDIILDHPLSAASMRTAAQVRETMGRELYRRAYFQFLRLYEGL